MYYFLNWIIQLVSTELCSPTPKFMCHSHSRYMAIFGDSLAWEMTKVQ
jgi:hypothetical protein